MWRRSPQTQARAVREPRHHVHARSPSVARPFMQADDLGRRRPRSTRRSRFPVAAAVPGQRRRALVPRAAPRRARPARAPPPTLADAFARRHRRRCGARSALSTAAERRRSRRSSASPPDPLVAARASAPDRHRQRRSTRRVRFLTPAQTVCNYLDAVVPQRQHVALRGRRNGTWQRFIIIARRSGPTPRAAASSAPPTAPPRQHLHANPYPNTAAPRPDQRVRGRQRALRCPASVIGNVPGNQGTATTHDQGQSGPDDGAAHATAIASPGPSRGRPVRVGAIVAILALVTYFGVQQAASPFTHGLRDQGGRRRRPN